MNKTRISNGNIRIATILSGDLRLKWLKIKKELSMSSNSDVLKSVVGSYQLKSKDVDRDGMLEA